MLNLNPLLRNNFCHLKMIEKVGQSEPKELEAFREQQSENSFTYKHIRNRQISFATTSKGQT